ncbi:MAG: hypothetical protein V3U03_02045 [Myxococcota bacterium]
MATRRKKRPKPRPPAAPSHEVVLEAVGPRGATARPGDLVLVVLEGFRIGELLSKDFLARLRNREGALAFEVGGQAQSFGWQTDGKAVLRDAAGFRGQLLYFGAPRGGMELRADVIETDREPLAKRTAAVDAALTFAANAAAFAPPYAPAIAAGAALLRALVKIFASRVDDDVELAFRGSLGRYDGAASGPDWPIESGRYRLVRRRRSPGRRQDDDADIALELALFGFEPLPATVERDGARHARHATLLLDGIDLSGLDRKAVGRRTLCFESTVASGRDRREFGFQLAAWNEPAVIDDVLGFHGQILYQGPWIGALPYSFGLVALEPDQLRGIDDLVDRAGDLASAIRELRGTDEDRAGGPRSIGDVAKATQSLAALAAEFAPGSVPVGATSGLVSERGRIAAPAGASLPAERFPVVSGADTDWQHLELPLQSEAGGRALLRLRLRQYWVPL